MKVRLHSLMKYPVTAQYRLRIQGKEVPKIDRFYPGKVYEFVGELITPLDSFTNPIAYSEEAIKVLESEGIPYEVIKGCGSCTGKRKKIKFPILEVVE